MSAGRAAKQIRRIAGDCDAARVGSFRGVGDAVPLLEWGEVADWLSRNDDIALFVHDDVDFDRNSIEKLADAHRRSGNPVAAGIEDAPGRAVDFPVLLGASASLAEMLRQPFSAPAHAGLVTLKLPQVRHANTCQPEEPRPLLVASMIVRDEAENLRRFRDGEELRYVMAVGRYRRST